MEDAYQQYLKDRHTAHVARRSNLDDLAFKTSERYDQWVLTLSGGALALSLTFLEKIAPEPAPYTLYFLGFSWLAYIVAVLAGFCAIDMSRKAIYRQLEIGDDIYEQFRKTTTEEKPEGDSLTAEKNENRPAKKVGCLNIVSLTFLVVGTILLCAFAIANLANTKAPNALDCTPQLASANSPQISTNITTTNKATPWAMKVKKVK
jgi:hypothetical protein